MTAAADDYTRRAVANSKAVQNVVDWLFLDSEARTANRSWGKQNVEICWEDGQVKKVRITPEHVLMDGDALPLPVKKPAAAP